MQADSSPIPNPKPGRLRSFRHHVAQWIIRLLGWKMIFDLPSEAKFIVIGAPHTSNWDLLFSLLLLNAGDIHATWVGKDSIFNGPLGWLMRRWGGIPVNRRERSNFVQQIVEEFNQRSEMVLLISPEGTRSKTKYWKTGFYYIALGAKVPVAMAYLDYSRKQGGVGAILRPSGDLEADFEQIKAFYGGIKGKYPDQQGEVRLAEKTPEQSG